MSIVSCRFADWNATGLGISPMENNKTELVLPLVLHYLTPRPVAIIGEDGIFIFTWVPSKRDSLIQCCFNGGPAS